jgi:hypothetical protein
VDTTGDDDKNDKGMTLSMHQPWASLLVHGIKCFEGTSTHAHTCKLAHSITHVHTHTHTYTFQGVDGPQSIGAGSG